MAKTSITTLYAGFLFVLLVIFVTEMAFGRRLEGEQLPTGIAGKAITPGAGQKGDTEGVAQQQNGLEGNGNAQEAKGKLEGTGSGSAAGVVTGKGTLKTEGDLPKGKIGLTGTGSMTVPGATVEGSIGGKPESNSQMEKPQTSEKSPYPKANEEAPKPYPPNY
ncbi:hypothetical protein C5167_021371 [Papaver somniferum]|uniref:Uncharacterized protein n=1 Tax=Papaver somniferum TaxID=3469 RepID=A0A4Y7IZM8_PAPSO|nr:hypothetical protein C5167_021371 [Papaver somniferum]